MEVLHKGSFYASQNLKTSRKFFKNFYDPEKPDLTFLTGDLSTFTGEFFFGLFIGDFFTGDFSVDFFRGDFSTFTIFFSLFFLVALKQKTSLEYVLFPFGGKNLVFLSF